MFQMIKERKFLLLPLLFSITLTFWAVSSLFSVHIFETILIISFLNTFLFAAFYSLRNRKFFGYALLFLGSAVFIMIPVLFAQSKGILHYYIWLATAKPSDKFVPEYWFATIMFICYGFSYIVYYFTIIRFRVFFILMTGIISFIMHSAKNQKDISLPFIMFSALFFMLYIHMGMKNKKGKYDFNTRRIWYFSSAAIFITLTITISFVLPKPDRIPQILYLDRVLTQAVAPIGAAVQNVAQGNNENTFSVNSSKLRHIDSYSAPLGNRVLFEVEANEPLYLVLQSYDYYSNNNWAKLNLKLLNGHGFDYYEPRNEKLKIVWDVKNTLKGFGYKDIENIVPSQILKLPSVPPKSSKAVVFNNGYRMMSYLSTPGTTGIEAENKKTVLMSESAQCFEKDGGMPKPYGTYTISYISQQLGPATREFNLVKRLSGDYVDKLLRDVYSNERSKLNDEEFRILESSINEMDVADENYLQLPLNIPKRIYDLSMNLTSGLKSDYDKANAIVEFLHGSEFSYELKQPDPPADADYNDFFIFQSKKGICIHFASAMTILARAAGLPARYVEGFSATEYDSSSGRYIVREKDAHAFPEVYIKGYGWMVFEPTPSIAQTNNNSFAFLIKIVNVFKSAAAYINALPVWIKLMFIPYILFVFFFMVWAFLKIRKKAWKSYLKRADRGHAVGAVLEKIAALLGKINLKMERYETPTAYAKRVYDESGINLVHLSEVYSRSRYGEIEPETVDVDTALKLYGEVSVYVRKRVGRLRGLLIG